VINLMVYAIAIPSIVVCGCAWLLSSRVYLLDMLVSQQMVLAWWALGVLVALVIMRRWKIAMLALVMCVLAFYPVVHGRTLWLPEVDFASKPEGVIRVVSCNFNPENELWEQALLDLMAMDADVVVLLEVPPEITRKIHREDWVGSDDYKYWIHRKWVENSASPGFILSRWPIKQIENAQGVERPEIILHAEIVYPTGSFIVGLMHPSSPRTEERWRSGNSATQIQALAAAHSRSQSRLPVLIGADVNAGVAQYRSRILRASGMHPTKPLSRPRGTFPSSGPICDVFSVAIDDVWSDGDLEIYAWSMAEITGSDHRAIAVNFRLNHR
jgi:endonuclease/exonuclease/phosphatase (EEP) superfamily protein YafD